MVDLGAIFSGQDYAALRLSNWDRHPNSEGHRMIADYDLRASRTGEDRGAVFHEALKRRRTDQISRATAPPRPSRLRNDGRIKSRACGSPPRIRPQLCWPRELDPITASTYCSKSATSRKNMRALHTTTALLVRAVMIVALDCRCE